MASMPARHPGKPGSASAAVLTAIARWCLMKRSAQPAAGSGRPDPAGVQPPCISCCWLLAAGVRLADVGHRSGDGLHARLALAMPGTGDAMKTCFS